MVIQNVLHPQPLPHPPHLATISFSRMVAVPTVEVAVGDMRKNALCATNTFSMSGSTTCTEIGYRPSTIIIMCLTCLPQKGKETCVAEIIIAKNNITQISSVMKYLFSISLFVPEVGFNSEAKPCHKGIDFRTCLIFIRNNVSGSPTSHPKGRTSRQCLCSLYLRFPLWMPKAADLEK